MIIHRNFDFNSINLMTSFCGEISFNGSSIFLPIFNAELINKISSGKKVEFINFCYFEFVNSSKIKYNYFELGEGELALKKEKEQPETNTFYFGSNYLRTNTYFELEIEASEFLLHIPKTSITQNDEFGLEPEISIIRKINMIE